MCQHEREHQGDIIAHGDPRSLESVVCGHHVYKYIWTPCLGERLSLRTDVGNLYDSYHTMLFGDKRDGGQPTENHLLCHDCRFHVTPSTRKLRYQCVALL